MIFHVFICPECEDEPDKVETQDHVDNYYGLDALTVAEPTAAHSLSKVKVVVCLILPFQVTEISILKL
jgi:predicted metal-binding protein